jgi:hypothetical protein
MKVSKFIPRKLNEFIFLRTGMKPWSRGYSEYKTRCIAESIHDPGFDPTKLSSGYGFRIDERIVEYPWFYSRLPGAAGKLLDAGSVLNVDYLLRHEKLESKKIFISTLAPEPQCFWNRGVSYLFEDLRDSAFRSDYFDWIVSLSTIEHIGMDNTMLYTKDDSKREDLGSSCLQAVKEYRRMLIPGGTLYLSFPFGKFENHGWFQVFDAGMLDEVIDSFGPSSFIESHYRYRPAGWCNSSRQESEGATYFDIHARRDYDPDFAAASRAIVCLELRK